MFPITLAVLLGVAAGIGGYTFRYAKGLSYFKKDPEACVRVAMTMLRESMRICPAHPVAFYAVGPGACTNARAQKISRDRMWLAARLAKVAP